MKEHFAGLFLAFGAVVAAPSTVSAMTVAEFDALPSKQRGQTLQDTVDKILNFYTTKNPEKAACITELYTPAEDGKISEGVEMLMAEIEKARSLNPQKYHIEAIIFGLSNRECPNTPAASPAR